MRSCFHQPYFLPWLGYFAKLHYADILVVLDDVQFRRNHIKRVHIRGTSGNREWLTLPVGENARKPINSIRVPKDERSVSKLIRTLELSYGSAPSFRSERDVVFGLVRQCYAPGRLLSEANVDAALQLNTMLGNDGLLTVMASDVCPGTAPTERVLRASSALGIRSLLVGDGGMSAVHDLDQIQTAGIELQFLSFAASHPEYAQTRQGSPFRFEAGLSVLDAIFNLGSVATGVLIRSSASPVSLSELS